MIVAFRRRLFLASRLSVLSLAPVQPCGTESRTPTMTLPPARLKSRNPSRVHQTYPSSGHTKSSSKHDTHALSSSTSLPTTACEERPSDRDEQTSPSTSKRDERRTNDLTHDRSTTNQRPNRRRRRYRNDDLLESLRKVRWEHLY